MSNQGAKQQIVDKIIDSDAILVALSKNPSVDELSAALGLTMLLNAAKHRTTAIFSGETPPVLQFLEPEKTFEDSVDSLRDFIVAISKDKADNLRMKVEGDQAKIYITPYRTTIDETDLDFSLGEYNVDTVIALGVTERDDLDHALSAHGKIFHDAAVVSLSNGDEKSTLGSIDWYEQNASSLSEMVMSLSDELHNAEHSVKMDKSIATAILTGIVASTERFSNSKTSPRVMNMASKLMSLGADQQLIATNLSSVIESADEQSNYDDKSGSAAPKKPRRTNRSGQKRTKKPKDPNELGALSISHEKSGDIEAVGQQTEQEKLDQAHKSAEDALAKSSQTASEQQQDEAAKLAEARLADQLDKVPAAKSASGLSVDDIQKDLASAAAESDADAKKIDNPDSDDTKKAIKPETSSGEKVDGIPTLGGTLNATTEQAATEKRLQEEADKNRTILSHNKGYVGGSEPTLPPVPINAAGIDQAEPDMVDPALDSDGPMQYEPTGRSQKVITPPSQAAAEPEAPVSESVPAPTAPAPAATPTGQSDPAPAPEPEQPAAAPQTIADLERLNQSLGEDQAQPVGTSTPEPVPAAPEPTNYGASQDGSALSAVEAALSEEAYNAKPAEAPPAPTPAPEPAAPSGDLGLPPPPPVPDFSNLGPAPDFSKLPPPPPVPSFPAPPVDTAAANNTIPTQEPNSNPAQFQIPGQ